MAGDSTGSQQVTTGKTRSVCSTSGLDQCGLLRNYLPLWAFVRVTNDPDALVQSSEPW